MNGLVPGHAECCKNEISKTDLKSTRSKSSITLARGWNQSVARLLALGGSFLALPDNQGVRFRQYL